MRECAKVKRRTESEMHLRAAPYVEVLPAYRPAGTRVAVPIRQLRVPERLLLAQPTTLLRAPGARRLRQAGCRMR